MSSVTILWPEKEYGICVMATCRKKWVFPQTKIPKNTAFLMELSPNLSSFGHSVSYLMFTSLTIGYGSLNVRYFDKSVDINVDNDVTITIRNIKVEDSYPEHLNNITVSGILHMNVFLEDEQGIFNYIATIDGTDLSIVENCKKFLMNRKLKPLDLEASLLNADFIPLIRVGELSDQFKAVMNLKIKPIKAIKFLIGDDEQVIRYLPQIPKQLLIWALRNINSSDDKKQEALKRRLLKITCNSGIPVDILSAIDNLGVDPNGFDRIGLPLDHWQDYVELADSDDLERSMYFARLDIDENVSEATLRLRVCDPLFRFMVSDLNCIESEYDLKKFIDAKNSVLADLALVTRSGKFPILVLEISALSPKSGHRHKDFVKLVSSTSRLCSNQCEELESRGEDPLAAKVFGIWVGGTNFQFCVATPEKRFNATIGKDEIYISVSFHDHWNFDLIKPHSRTDCTMPCCSQPKLDLKVMKPASVNLTLPDQPLSTDVPANLNLPEDDDEPEATARSEQQELEATDQSEEATDQSEEASKIPKEHEYNMKDVCILKLFIELAKKHMRTIDLLFAKPKLDPGRGAIAFGTSTAIITKSSAASDQPTPKKSRPFPFPDAKSAPSATTNSNALDIASDLFYHHNNSRIVLKKVPTREIDVYEAIPGPFKLFFPFLWDFNVEVDEDGDKVHVFTLERLLPFILDEGGYNAFFRMETFEEFILEAATMAVHVLFGLLILHEEAGFVHADISPNNLMFSPQQNLWKIIDFNLSLPIEESLSRSRSCGTDGFKAPESVETGIYSPASDVCSVGMVLQACFCPYLPQYAETSQHSYDLWEFNDLVSQLTRKDPAERLSVRAALDKFIKFVYSHTIPDFSIYGSTLLFPAANIQLSLPPPDLEKDISLSKITTN